MEILQPILAIKSNIENSETIIQCGFIKYTARIEMSPIVAISKPYLSQKSK